MAACSSDETSAPPADVSADAGADTSAPVDGAANDGGASAGDAAPSDGGPTDAPVDAAVDAPACDAGLVQCTAGGACVDLSSNAQSCGTCGTDCRGATCANGLCAPEKVSPALCAWGVTVAGGRVFWTENAAGGCNGAVRSCATTGCTALPGAIATPSNYPMGIAVPSGVAAVFYGDNQYPGHLRKMDVDGQNLVDFANGVDGNSAAVVANATHVFWGNGSGVYRTSIGTADSVKVLSGNVSGAVDNSPQSIALDATSFYAAPDGFSLRACPLAGDCSANGSTLVATEPSTTSSTGISGIASDGTNVFYTAGNHYAFSGGDKVERLVRCPVGGCANAAPVVLWQSSITTNFGQSSHLGIAVDAKNVYWGTIAGTIWFAPKTCAAPCAPKALVTGAQVFGMAIDGPYLYWADGRGGIYRIVRP